MERFTLAAEDGFTIAAVRWLPSGPVRAVLQVCHGMAEHVTRYEPLAQACIATGIAVYGHDHRGHGASVDENTPLGHFGDQDGWGNVLGDLRVVQRWVRDRHPQASVFMFGHSMGSFVVRSYLLDHADTLAAAIISATGWRMGPLADGLAWVARREAARRGVRTPSRLMTKLVFGSFNIQFGRTRTGFDWLSRDPAQVDAYVADRLCGFDCSGTSWNGMLTGMRALERGEKDSRRLSGRLPLLLVAGSRDPVSMGGRGNSQLASCYRAAGNRHVTVKRYPGARHELLNETIRAEFLADTLHWMDRQIGIQPGEEERPVKPA